MTTVDITAGGFDVPAGGALLVGIVLDNASDTEPAQVTITQPDGRHLWDANIAPRGSVATGGLNPSPLDPGQYTIELDAGAVTGTITLAGL